MFVLLFYLDELPLDISVSLTNLFQVFVVFTLEVLVVASLIQSVHEFQGGVDGEMRVIGLEHFPAGSVANVEEEELLFFLAQFEVDEPPAGLVAFLHIFVGLGFRVLVHDFDDLSLLRFLPLLSIF